MGDRNIPNFKKCKSCGEELQIAGFAFLWNGEEYCDRECAEIKAKSKVVDDRNIPQTGSLGISEYTRDVGNSDKPSSIWKDVSECLKEYEIDQGKLIIAQWHNGYCSFEDIEHVQMEFEKHQECCIFKRYCTLTDFINSFESEKQAREKLEERVEKLEKKKEVDLEKLEFAKDAIYPKDSRPIYARQPNLLRAIELIIEVLEGNNG